MLEQHYVELMVDNDNSTYSSEYLYFEVLGIPLPNVEKMKPDSMIQ